MRKKSLKDIITLKGMSGREKAAAWWLAASLCLMCSVTHAPCWARVVLAVNLFAAWAAVSRIEVPGVFGEEEEEE